MMSENSLVTWEAVNHLAERLVRGYIRGLLSVEEFTERLKHAWEQTFPGETLAGPAVESLARGLCSQILCEACYLSTGPLRDLAFARLSEYLERMLGDVRGQGLYAASEVREEVIQQTLVEILRSGTREGRKPVQPMAFLGWARVILRRQLTHYWRQRPQVDLCSLEMQDEEFGAALPDEYEKDPLDTMLRHELRAELFAAIANLRNAHYREVLMLTYFGDLEDLELATCFQVSTKTIYLWRFRALQMLRKHVERGLFLRASHKV